MARGTGERKADGENAVMKWKCPKCGRLEWSCLDWNKPSIDFYLSLGAVPMDDWTTYRLTGKTMEEMAR